MMNVLLVDDSAVMRAVVQKTLEMSGVPIGRVFHAANGVEGLDLLRHTPIDLLMLDISMPLLRGDEMLEELRADTAFDGLHVIVVSSERSDERIARMEALGAVFVKKPFAPEQIRSVITGILAAPR